MNTVNLVMNAVEFTVYGTPQPKGSARAFVLRNKVTGATRAIVTSANPKLKTWAETVRNVAQQQPRWYSTEAVVVTLWFGLQRPASVSAKKRPFPVVTPDLDKLVRAAMDTLTGVFFKDDAQVVSIRARKHYVEAAPYVSVAVQEFKE